MPNVAQATADLEASAKTALTVLRSDTAAAIRDCLLQLRRDVLAAGLVKNDPRFNPTYATQQYVADVQAARVKANDKLDTVETAMEQAVDSVRAKIAKSTMEQRSDTAELAHQLQRQAAARRIDILRGAGVESAEIIRRLAAQGDTLGLEVVASDLPFMFSESRHDQLTLQSLQAQLDQAATPLMSAAVQAGRALSKELADGVYQLKIAFTLARNEATGAASGLAMSNTASNIPAWVKGDTFMVAFKTPDGGAPSPSAPLAGQ
jgi:hypothetical protein